MIGKLLKDKLTILLGEYPELLENISDVDTEFFKRLEKIIKQLELKDGVITRDNLTTMKINQLTKELIKAIAKTDYAKDIKGFSKTFEKLDKSHVKIVELANSLTVSKALVKRERAFAINQTIGRLNDLNGLEANVINRYKRAIVKSIQSGETLNNLTKKLRNISKSKPFEKHVRTLAVDSLGSYEGQLNKAMSEKYGLDTYIFMGPVDDRTRPQCRHWATKRRIKVSELDSEVKRWKDSTGYDSANALTKENWAVVRGGYQCRHSAVPIRSREESTIDAALGKDSVNRIIKEVKNLIK